MKKLFLYTGLYFSFFLFFIQVAASQSFNISLRVNQEEQDTVFRNETILFDLNISNLQAQSDARWNMAADRRLKQIDEWLKQGKMKQEDYDKEKASIVKNRRTPSVITIGSGSGPWTNAVKWKITNTANRNEPKWPISIMVNPAVSGSAILDANGYYIASYGVPPDDLLQIPPGTYAVEVSINNIFSNAVLVNIESTLLSETIAASESFLLRWGQYYWHAGDGDKTIRYADRILAGDPSSLDGLSLKGDGLVLQKSYLPALEAYNKAQKEYYKKYGTGAEPPEYLMNMISWLKHELGEPTRGQ